MAVLSNLPCNNRTIGIDVHKKVFVCCGLSKDPSTQQTYIEEKRFGTNNSDIKEAIEWIAAWNADVITMESTGIYWETLGYALRDAGFRVNVVNPRYVKGLKGHKTDANDAEWLAHVSTTSSTCCSFLPTAEYRELRVLERQRVNYVQDLQRAKNRFAKELVRSNVMATSVFSDLSGKNARKALKALIAGKSPKTIVQKLDLKRLKAKEQEIIDALSGKLTANRILVLTDILTQIERLEALIAKYDKLVVDAVRKCCPVHFAHLNSIPGVNDIIAATFLIEMGGDIEPFPSAEKFASWLGICPGNNESAGKRLSGATRKGNKYIRRVLIEAAHAIARRKRGSLASKFQVLRGRLGYKKAIVAIAHKLARIMYALIKNVANYRDPQIDHVQVQTCRRAAQNLKRIANATGISITAHNTTTGEVLATASPRVPFHERPEAERQLIVQQLPGVKIV